MSNRATILIQELLFVNSYAQIGQTLLSDLTSIAQEGHSFVFEDMADELRRRALKIEMHSQLTRYSATS
jgi:hypothetical protein